MSGVAAAVGAAQHASLLAQLPFLSALPADELEPFAQAALVRRYRAGEAVVCQGEFGHSMFVVTQGQFAISAISDNGKRLDLGRFERPGEFFGEVALLGRGVRTATVTALGPAEVLEIEKSRFELLARRHGSVRSELDKYYHARAITTYTRLHRYLGALDESAVRELTANAVMKKFQRDETVLRAGAPRDAILLVKDGVLKATRQRHGKTSILAYFNTDDIIGAYEENSFGFDLTALGQVEIIYLDVVAFAAMAQRHPEVAARFRHDDVTRQDVLHKAGATVFAAAHAFLEEGVEVESLLVINLDRCVRCGNCVRACHARHSFTRLDRRGPIFKRRKQVGSSEHEHVMLPSSCRHCRDPECMIGCPTGAIQRSVDGDVDINDNCIGCENCARKCPYGNITMRPLAPSEQRDGVTQRAIKCNLCRGHSYSNCVHECPRGAILRVDPLRYFDELALIMEPEQQEAIEWRRFEAQRRGMLDTKQRVKPRSTRFVTASLLLLVLGLLATAVAYGLSPAPHRGGTPWGLGFGVAATVCLGASALLGIRKRLRTAGLGALEVWTQFHMVFGALGFVLALCHAGFRITGPFTAILLVLFAVEVFTGVLGQAIYMVVPKLLTRLERGGQAKLVEDLLEEQQTLDAGIAELGAKLPAALAPRLAQVERAAGSVRSRYAPTYEPEAARAAAIASVPGELAPEHRTLLERLAADLHRRQDVRAQLTLHRRMKTWLVLHIACASALVVFLAFHIVTMLVVLGV